MRLLVCGHRHLADRIFVFGVLDGFARVHGPITCLIEGEAPGPDTLSRLWAEEQGIPVEKYPADWKRYGHAAGPIRNQQMLDEGKPDHVIAFLAEVSIGTRHMIKIARAAGIPVEVIEI